MYRAFPLAAHPMAVTSVVVGALSTFYQDSLDPLDPEQVDLSTYRLLAKLPTICAVAFKYSMGHPFNYPRNELGYAANMLHMMFALPTEEYEVNETFTRAVETLLNPARRPRAELLDEHDAARRKLASEHLRLRLGGDHGALGSAARRRQPGRDRDAP